jgi:TetR/AcrR family fatty acid metabolism transcriptional regulator
MPFRPEEGIDSGPLHNPAKKLKILYTYSLEQRCVKFFNNPPRIFSLPATHRTSVRLCSLAWQEVFDCGQPGRSESRCEIHAHALWCSFMTRPPSAHPTRVRNGLLLLLMVSSLNSRAQAEDLRTKTAVDLVHTWGRTILRVRPWDRVTPPTQTRMDVLVGRDFGSLSGYLYFKGKEDLLTAIFDEFMERFLHTLQSELEGMEGAPQRLQRIIELHLRGLGEDRDLSTVVQIELRHTSRFMDMYSRGRLRDYFLLIDSVLKAGKQEGSIRSDLNTWFTTKCIFGVVDEAATNWVLSKHNYRLHSMVDPIMEFIMAGIKPS